MDLDVRTMMFMVAGLAFMLALVLGLASLEAANMRGIRTWALAELCFAGSFGVASANFAHENPWVAMVGASVLALGFSLQGVGARRFFGQDSRWGQAFGTPALLLLINVTLEFADASMHGRQIANALVLATTHMLNAHSVLKHHDSPLRGGVEFTGGLFILQTQILIGSALYMSAYPVENHGYDSLIVITPLTFFMVALSQLILAFGFVLMMHYRVAGQLKAIARQDGLTGAMNRRRLEEEFAYLRALYLRNGGVLSLLMIDVDHFKAINDRHGHLVGDEVLRKLAKLAMTTIRRQDFFARYGGEEFCVLMPATTESDAVVLAERLRQAYASLPMGTPQAPWSSTISIGVASSTLGGLDFESLVNAADHAMYAAKAAGRNRVVVYSGISQLPAGVDPGKASQHAAPPTGGTAASASVAVVSVPD